MPSRADRSGLERALRAVAWVALGALLARSAFPPRPGGAVRRVEGSAALPRALAEALAPAPPSLDLVLDSLPGAATRALARAIAAAGTRVRWREAPSAPLPHLGLAAEPIADPGGRTRLTVLGGGARTLALRDDAGALDSAKLSGAGVRQVEALAGDVVRAVAPRGGAIVVRRDSLLLRPVLVVGRAGWEGKFVVAALEEAGWRVEARLAVAPDADVRQGDAPAPDTARFAAVVALDASVAPMAASVARFVRSGGGLVVLADAANVPALGALLPAAVGEAVPAIPGALVSPEPRRGLGGYALARLRSGAVALDVAGERPRVAAARAELGRVVLSGYRDSWRWRMEGDDSAPAAHRAFWNGLVAAVAHAPLASRVAGADSVAGPGPVPGADALADPAPYAALVSALGMPTSAADDADAAPVHWPWDTLLLAAFTMALLGEWGSRRLRGAR